MNDFSSEKTTIADLFSKKDVKYRVPSYQRQYSWSEEYLNNMWNDVCNEEVYFLGTFVLNNEFFKGKKIKDIVDGQQRMISITILFAVIRDEFLKLKETKGSDGIQTSYIAQRDDDGNDAYRVIPGDSLKEFFERGIQKANSNISELSDDTKEKKRIKSNYLFFQKKIEEEINKHHTKEDRMNFLRDLREKVKKLSIVLIEVPSEEDAFTFFETLNARGMQLSTSDLIKNLLFKNIIVVGSSNSKRQELEQKWQNIIDNLTGEEEIDPTQFMRHYWLSKYKKITEKKLFREIKEAYQEKNYGLLLDDLVNNSEFYKQITFPEKSYWDNKLLDIYKSISRLKSLNVKQPYSLLLSLLRVIDDDKFFNKVEKKEETYFVFKWIEHFTFVFTSVVGKSPSPLEGIYSHYAIEIEESRVSNDPDKFIQTLKKLRDRLLNDFPTENEFKENFIKISYRKSLKQINFIKYIFEKINYFEDDHEQTFDHITIEHILPQNPDQEWHVEKEEIKDHVNEVGNLVVLGKGYNRSSSNKIIKSKITEYKKSDLKVVRELVGKLEELNYNWNKRNIENRGKELAKKAWQVWQLR